MEEYLKPFKMGASKNDKPLEPINSKPLTEEEKKSIKNAVGNNRVIKTPSGRISKFLSDVPSNKANAKAAQSGKKCANFCRKSGLQILPLRYAVVQQKAPQLSAGLGAHVKNIKLSHSQYTVEMIDGGYIYVLVKRAKGFEWMGYLVTPKGHLSYFVVDQPAPTSVTEFACKGVEHDLFSSFITIEYIAENLAEKAYIIHTYVALTKVKRLNFQSKAEDYVVAGKWQKIDVAAWSNGSSKQEHCLTESTLKAGVFNPATFGTDRWKKILKKNTEKPKAYASIALYDPIRITVNLNDFRNLAYAPIDAFLTQRDNNGVSNQRKLDAAQRIDHLKGFLSAKYERRLNQAQNDNKKLEADTRPYLESKYQRQIDILDHKIKDAEKKGDHDQVSALQRSRQIALEDQKRVAQKRLENIDDENKQAKNVLQAASKADFSVIEDNIDLNEVETFKGQVAAKYDQAIIVANQRAQDHLNWINSESLQNALDVYDEQNLSNGSAFKAHVASMLFGMEGSTEAAKQLDAWIKKPTFERKNLFIRGLYSNQKEAKSLHEQLVNKATDPTAIGIKTLKGIIDFLKKTDAAWDEWARVHTEVDKNGNPTKLKGNIFFTDTEKKVMLYVSNFARVVFRSGMGTKAEHLFVKAISERMLFVQMGELAEKLRFDEVVHGIDPEKNTLNKIKLNPEFAQRVGAQVAKNSNISTVSSIDVLIEDAMVKKEETSKKLDEIVGKKMTDATNNYHQVRASGVLVFIEALNLTHMLNSGKYKTKEQIAALTASISSLFAFGLDIFYGLAKGVRETASHSTYTAAGAGATRAAANIQRAAIKWVAGSLSSFAGGITAVLDVVKAVELWDKKGLPLSLFLLYLTRGVAGFIASGLGLLATLTYIGPLLNYLKRIGGSSTIQKIGGRLVGATAMYGIRALTLDAIRVSFLRWIAWLSGFGLVLTIIEVGYIVFIEATKLRRWCEHSTFRFLKNNELMSEKQEEDDFQKLVI